MSVQSIIKKGEYYDSVTLMRVAKTLAEQKGALDSAVVMATPENKEILSEAGLLTSEIKEAKEVDLVIVVKSDSDPRAKELLTLATGELKTKTKARGSAPHPRSLAGALETLPAANLAIISIAGRYAGDEAMKALERGLHVMLFSDNVPIEKEVELKKFAASKGLLVMGPDAGTAILNGIPLAFANNVNRGSVGIVAASGTGLQETSTLISNLGAGISQAIGTGGRDIKKEVGGIMFLESVKALLDDEQTEVLLLVSKPPHESVLKKILEATSHAKKPVIAVFLGAQPAVFAGSKVIAASNLEEGATLAALMALKKPVDSARAALTERRAQLSAIAKTEAKKLKTGQRFIRGLYTGGTFVGETQVLCQGRLQEVHSNAPYGEAQRLKNSNRSEGHAILDFGEDEFTVGRPHPMIDFSLRNKRILDEARDSETAVLLLDLVLGWGANQDPLPELLPVLKEAKTIARNAGRELPIVMSVTGTDADPQNRAKVVEALVKVGALVEPSNAAAAELSIQIIENARK